MKKKFNLMLIVVFCLLAGSIQAQTLVLNPNAEGGFELGNTFAANGWTVINNNTGGNNWYLSNSTLTAGPYSFAPTGNRVAYISQFNNGAWSYNINQYSTTHIYRDVTFPPGEEIIKLKLRWNAYGEGPVYDVLYIFTAPTTLTPVVGVPSGTNNNTNSWTGTGASQLHATLHSSSNYNGSTTEYTLPASFAGTTRRLIFSWKNGNTLGFQPPAAIDSIWLFTDCPKPTVSIQNLTPMCSSNVVIQASVQNASSNGSYQWFVNNGLVPGANTATFQSNTLAPGSTIKCVYSMNNACGYKDSAMVTMQSNTNSYKTETLTVCSNALPIVWRGVNIPIHATSNPNFTSVVVPTPGACDSIITLNLQVKATPAPVIETINACRGQLGQMTWRGKTLPNDAQSNTRYDSVTLTSANGCDSLIYLNLNVLETAEIITDIIEDCKPVVFNGKRYDASAIEYDTTRSSSSFCDSLIRITHIRISPFDLNLSLLHPKRYVNGEMITLNAAGNAEHFEILSWTPQELFLNQSSASQTIKGPSEALITVIAKTEMGCTDTSSLLIKAVDQIKDFEMPNAFTPNGDGKNDFFGPVFAGKNDYSIVQFDVYNRWGQNVYAAQSGSPSMFWDGTHNGKIVDNGVYFYSIKVKYFDGTTQVKKGEVVLLK